MKGYIVLFQSVMVWYNCKRGREICVVFGLEDRIANLRSERPPGPANDTNNVACWLGLLMTFTLPPLSCGLQELLSGHLAQCSHIDLQGVTGTTNMTANLTLSLLVESLSLRANATNTGRLRSLVLSGNPALGDDGPTKLAPVLATHPALRSLLIDECNVSHVGASLLADALRQGAGLETLSLSHNQIGEAGAAALARVLPESRLVALHLQCSQVGANGAAAIASALGESTTRSPTSSLR